MKPTPNKPSWHYFKVRALQSAAQVTLSSIPDFVRYAELYAVKAMLLVQAADDDSEHPTYFALAHNGLVVQQDACGFKCLEDFVEAEKQGFTLAGDYYDAAARGIHLFTDYALAQQSNIVDTAVLDAMKAGGYIAGFDAWKNLPADVSGKLPGGEHVTDAHTLYLTAQKAGFPDYAELEVILTKGFTNYGDYRAASDKGYPDAATYEDSLRRGFLSYANYQFAEQHQLRDAADATAFLAMVQQVGGVDIAHDEKTLLSLLARIEEGKRISINKINEYLAAGLDTHRYADTGEMPPWFTRALHSREDIICFFTTRDEPRQYGTFDTDGEFFQVARLQQRHVVIDGSNVAYNSVGGKEKIPLMANMLQIVRYLKTKGFEHIAIISDASLSHRLPDMQLLAEIEAEAEYIVAPAEKPADIFLIQYVKDNHCLLVSNDTFREWKVGDAWVATNIDFYRLTFLIKDQQVLMPDLEHAS